MAKTVLHRKERRNKVASDLKKQKRKLQTTITYVKSPFKGESGIIIEE